jgi:hypothetical protein
MVRSVASLWSARPPRSTLARDTSPSGLTRPNTHGHRQRHGCPRLCTRPRSEDPSIATRRRCRRCAGNCRACCPRSRCARYDCRLSGRMDVSRCQDLVDRCEHAAPIDGAHLAAPITRTTPIRTADTANTTPPKAIARTTNMTYPNLWSELARCHQTSTNSTPQTVC